jgi:hypothetical protein
MRTPTLYTAIAPHSHWKNPVIIPNLEMAPGPIKVPRVGGGGSRGGKRNEGKMREEGKRRIRESRRYEPNERKK